MINPLGIFEKVKEGYISYIKTAFGTRYEDFEANRENLLNTDKVLYRQPWIEPLLEYKSAEGKEIKNLTEQDLFGFTKKDVELFNGFVSKGLFTGNYPLYEHQFRMLQLALEGNNCVITSGTGSGKTEAFLLPLIAYLLKDLSKYISNPASVNAIGPHSYRQGPTNIIIEGNTATLSDRVLQRSNENRPQAIKALIVYPMNALVEDQLTRLRMTLDNDEVREFCDSNLNGNRLFFGRYNSTAPVSGRLSKENDGVFERNESKWAQLKKQLKNIETTYSEIETYLSSDEGLKLSEEEKLELKTNFQRLDGAEMRSRFDMHQTPPDVMITNFSMLSIVLMRAIESGMLEETKKWLEGSTDWDIENLSEEKRAQEKEARIFHIVIDELHLYRGTPGTEISYLLRLLYSRLGLDPSSSKVRFLASSASLDGQVGSQEYEDSQSFLKGFFGINKEMKVIDGTYKLPKQVNQSIDPSMFMKLAEFSADIFGSDEEAFIDEIGKKVDKWLQCKSGEGVPQLLEKVNSDENLKSQLIYAFRSKNEERFRPFPVYNNKEDEDKSEQFVSLGRKLFDHLETDEEIYNAIKGLLLLRGLFDTKYGEGITCNLPRFRMHFFIRNIEGLWTTLKNDQEGTLSSDRNEDPFNELLEFSKIKHNNKRVFESLYCENCGTTFIGGTKIKYTDKKTFWDEIITTPPEIESIPEKSQSAMVERRTELDYAVFWPKYFENDEIIEDLTDEDNIVWQKRYLGVFDGKLYSNRKPNTVEGLYYNQNEGNESNESGTALPHSCPNCAADYQYRKKRKSPIRGFRTGFGKTNQILAKELFSAIPDKEKQRRKLVAFSDSREESARFANDIEKENYNQIIKELLLDQRDETIFAKELFTSIEVGNEALQRELFSKMDREYAIKINNAYKAINDPVFPAKPEEERLVSDVKRGTIKLEDLVDKIIFGLVKKGLNPAGPAASKQRLFVRDGSNFNEKTEHWKDCFDWKKGEINKSKLVSTRSQDTLMDEIRGPVYKEISSFIFGRLFYSMESSALGVVKISSDIKNPIPQIIDAKNFGEALNSLTRILGDNYKHRYTDYKHNPVRNYENLSKKRPEKKYIKSVASRLKIDEDQLGNALWNALTNDYMHYDGVLNLETLRIYFATDDDKVYKCQYCKTVHLHPSAGICKSCFKHLPKTPNLSAKDARENNFYAKQLLDNHEIIRMRCEELTGQTDNQLERQRLFKGIITGDNKIVEEIDLLSVTTTLEVGVDIGSLQAVYQGNMSPMRFNYQQRVGRAGRAGQAFNVALTFCRGRSHDEYFFNNPERMTGDISPVPFLSQSQDQILYRMIIKGVLQKYFEDVETTGSVHGEFGKIEDFFDDDHEKLNDLKEWIRLEDNWREIYKALTHNLFVNNTLYLEYNIDNFKHWIDNTFFPKFSKIQEDHNSGDLSEALADSGILPMSGMPTGLRNLILGFEEKSDTHLEAKTISRPIERAIFDFAPGAQKTKDKRIYTSIGLSPAISEIYKDYSNNGIWTARYYDQAAYKKPKWVILNSQNNILKTIEYEEGKDRDYIRQQIDETCETEYLVVSPNAFRTDWSPKPQDREVDQEISTSKPLLFSEAINPDDEGTLIGNCIIGIAPSDFTWRLNTNGGDEFNFLQTTDKYYADFSNQFFDLGLKKKLGFGFDEAIKRNLINDKLSNDTQVGKKLSLGAQKTTNVIRLHPAQLDFSLDINPFHTNNMGKKVSSKGAFHSAAYLLQRCLADLLDVSPEEIELAAITEQKLDDITARSTGRIVLSDELPNGSGFVEYLHNHIDMFFKMCLEPKEENRYTSSFINEEHAKSCKDSCYKDLKNYRNLNYHGILDWRLAVGLIRVLSDRYYLSGLDGNWDYIEIADWPEMADEYAKDFAITLGIDIVQNPSFYNVIENIPVISFKDINIIITHPFWNTSSFPKATSLSRVVAECANPDRIFFADTFNLNRRMAWCYEEFFKWLKQSNKK
ncbi:DEAD/DEAH box helicase [Hanstruepera ponticola]|uniref:DEAD/DEAH box helicase n=1 Tax=Hanstruepera ponticola TaxID=2042995 RepID=UPI001782107D|nr:DEAD/DEAH box helicase [Hanstruepera ponticola]